MYHLSHCNKRYIEIILIIELQKLYFKQKKGREDSYNYERKVYKGSRVRFAYQLSFSGTVVPFGQTILTLKLSKSAKLYAAHAARAKPPPPSYIY